VVALGCCPFHGLLPAEPLPLRNLFERLMGKRSEWSQLCWLLAFNGDKKCV